MNRDAGTVRVSIYDQTGREVARLCDGVRRVGRTTETWNGTDQERRKAPTGVYFVVITAPSEATRSKFLT